jgi:hypothetical protein
MKRIGSAFSEELAAAGLAGLPFSWNEDGEVTYGPTVTAEQRAAVAAVLAAHDPQKPATPKPGELRRAALLSIAEHPEAVEAFDGFLSSIAKRPDTPKAVKDYLAKAAGR